MIQIDGLHDLTADQLQGLASAGNVAPVATVDSYSTNEDEALIIGATGVLLNDTDADGDPLTAVVVSGVQHGTLALNSMNGSFSYTPNANYNGADSFTYKANDGPADSNVATVSLTVTPVNDAPVASNDGYATNEDTVLTVDAAAGVLINDTDADNDPLTAALVSGVQHGMLALNANGSFSYTPDANYNGPDSFTYKAFDGSANSDVTTVSITVDPVNDVATFTIGSGGNFDTITAALALGLVHPGDTLALLPGYNTENAIVSVENLTFNGDASNTGIALTLSGGIVAVTLAGTAPIAVTGNPSDNSITGNDASNVIAGGPGNDSINGGAGADIIYYTVGDFFAPGDGIDTINGGADHDTLSIFGTPFDTFYGNSFHDIIKGFGGSNHLTTVVVDGAITGIAGGTLVNVESVILDLGEEVDTLDYAGTMEAVTVNLATGTATGFTSIAGVENAVGGSGNDVLTGDAGLNFLTGGLGADTFGFSFNSVGDAIADWESSDIIDLAAIDANTNLVGNQDFTFLGLGAADLTVGQGQLKYYHAGGNTYVVGNVTANNQADFQIQINGVHDLTAAQILGLAPPDMDDPPNDITVVGGGSLTANEFVANGMLVGTVVGQDPDSTAFTYSLVDDAGGRFTINASTGAITVANGLLLDFEQNPTHVIRARVEDQALGALEKDFTVTINNVDPENIVGDAFTIGSGGNFDTITAALASGSVVPGDTLALLSGYSTEFSVSVGIENLTFSGDASNTGISLTLSGGITAVTLTGTAPIAVTGNESDNSITGNDGSNVLADGGGNDSINGGGGDDTFAGGEGNDSINGGAGADTILYGVGDDFVWPSGGIDTIDGGPDQDTLIIVGFQSDNSKGLRRQQFAQRGRRERRDQHRGRHTCQCRERHARPRRCGGRAGLRRHDGGRDRKSCDWYGDRLHLNCGCGERFRGLRQ